MRKKNVILFGLLSAAMLSLTVTGCGGEKEGEKQGGEVTQAVIVDHIGSPHIPIHIRVRCRL